MAPADMSYLERMVVKPTWKQILLELIDQEKIDPWDVDITKLADEFMARVHEMQTLDLGLHANVILATAILLKYKSDYLKYFTAPPVMEVLPEAENTTMDFYDTPQLSLVGRIPPKRQITIDELMTEMEKVIKYESNDIKRTPKGAITEYIDLNLPGEDIEKVKADILERIKANVDETGFATFSSVLRERTNREIIYSLLAILHLTQDRLVAIHQENFFDEILICLLDEDSKGNKEKNVDDAEIEEKVGKKMKVESKE